MRCHMLVALAILMIGSGAVLAAEPQTFEAPTHAVGDEWVRKAPSGTYTVAIVKVADNGGVATISKWPGVRFHYDRHHTITKVEGEPTKVAPIAFLANGWQLLQFPLYVGKKWTYSVQGSTAHFTIDVKVKKLTKVKTKAGKFEALLIDTCWTNNNSGWSDCGQRYWYAPAVKNFVRRDTPSNWASSLVDNDYKLISYKLVGQ